MLSLEPPLPRELQIEVTAACNLRCRMCLVRYRPPFDRLRGSIDFARFRRLVDELPDLEKITLQGLGEPLLAPDVFRMVEYAAARGIRIGFNTNATLLTAARAERLVRAGLDWLHVSLDGASPATYEGIRDGARFARVEANVRELVRVRDALGATRPRLALVFVAMRRNLHELSDVVRLASTWGIPRLRVQNLSHSFSDAGDAPDYAEIAAFAADEALWDGDEAVARTFDQARRVADGLGVELRLPALTAAPETRPHGSPGCDWPWRAAYVTHDGTVQPCCMLMGEDRGVMGDATRAGLAVVWRNEEYRRFRQALLGDEPPAVCRGCAMYRGVF